MRKNFRNIILVIVLVELMAVSFCNVSFFQLEIGKAEFCMRRVREEAKTNIETIIDKLNSYKKENPELKHKIEMITFLLESDDKFVQIQGLRAILSLPEDKVKPLVDESLNELKELLSISSESKYFSSVIKATGEFLKYVDERKPEISDRLKRIFKSDNFSIRDRIAIIEAIGNLIIGYKKAGMDFENIDSEERDSLRVLMNYLIFGLEQNEEIKLKIAALETLAKLHKYRDVSNILEKTKSIKTIEKIAGKKLKSFILKRNLKSPKRLLGLKKKPGGEEKVSRLKLWSTAAKYLILTNKVGDSKQQITTIIDQLVGIMEEITEKIEVDETVSFPILNVVTLEATKLSPYLLNESSGIWPAKNWDKFELLRENFLSLMGKIIKKGITTRHDVEASIYRKLYSQIQNWIECILLISRDEVLWENLGESVKEEMDEILDKVWKYAGKESFIERKIKLYSLLGQVGYKKDEILKKILIKLRSFRNFSINGVRREVAKAIADILLSEEKLDGTKSGLEYREVNETD